METKTKNHTCNNMKPRFDPITPTAPGYQIDLVDVDVNSPRYLSNTQSNHIQTHKHTHLCLCLCLCLGPCCTSMTYIYIYIRYFLQCTHIKNYIDIDRL